jgi:hypothetical protein
VRNRKIFFSPPVQFLFSPVSVRQLAGKFLFKTGGTGVTSNHDKEADRGSDSVFYRLV